jgi:hypothetical protein
MLVQLTTAANSSMEIEKTTNLYTMSPCHVSGSISRPPAMATGRSPHDPSQQLLACSLCVLKDDVIFVDGVHITDYIRLAWKCKLAPHVWVWQESMHSCWSIIVRAHGSLIGLGVRTYQLQYFYRKDKPAWVVVLSVNLENASVCCNRTYYHVWRVVCSHLHNLRLEVLFNDRVFWSNMS